jgi:hypothetical protein
MRYRDLIIVERRRSEKGLPRAHKDRASQEEIAKFKADAVKELKQLAYGSGVDFRDLYISYTALDKIGINPVSRWNTPIGIYSYPLRYALKKMELSNDSGAVPFMGDQPYIWLFAPKHPDRGLELETYTDEQLAADLEKVKNFLLKQGMTEITIDSLIEEGKRTARPVSGATPAAVAFWNTTRLMGIKFGEIKQGVDTLEAGDFVKIPEWTGYKNTIGMISTVSNKTADVKMYKDDGTFEQNPLRGLPIAQLVKTNPPVGYQPDKTVGHITKGVFNIDDEVEIITGPFKDWTGEIIEKTGDTYTVNLVMFGKATPIPDIPAAYLKLTSAAPAPAPKPEPNQVVPATDDDIIDLDFEPEPVPTSPNAKFESIIKENQYDQTRAKTAIIEWNRLMRVAGYEFIVDRNESGTIHPNEPTQAVFLSGTYFDTIGKILNTAKNVTTSPPYTIDQINDGKYDPVTFERWLKKNYKNYTQLNGLSADSVIIKSDDLIIKLVVHDDRWMDIIRNADLKYDYLIVKAKAHKLATVLNTDDEFYVHRTITELADVYTDNEKDLAESDAAILKHPKFIMDYIERVRKTPWPAAERVISQNPNYAYRYAVTILDKPWPAGENAISKNPDIAFKYARYVLNGRFPQGEPAILLDPASAVDYAMGVLNKPWPEAEEIIKSNATSHRRYRRKFPLFDDIEDFKVGDAYMEIMPGLQRMVVIAEEPVQGKLVQVHVMSQKGALDTAMLETLAPITPNRHGYKFGDQLKISDDGETGILVEIERKYYIFVVGGERKTVHASSVFEMNPKQYVQPTDFAVGDTVEFDIDKWDDGSEVQKTVGIITKIPQFGKAVVKYGSWGDEQEVDTEDLKHYIGKYT